MRVFRFIDEKGTFVSKEAFKIKTLYFPLCNENIMSSITPDLHGDIKSDQNSFLLIPVSRIDLENLRASRNFWIYIEENKQSWSLTGVSKDIKTIKEDNFLLSAGLLWHKIERENKRLGLRAEILSFVPSSLEPVEITKIKITNISSRPLNIVFTSAIPLYCRSAENIRDHRHVTSLLNRIILKKWGIIVKPTLLFDETGHKPNKNIYFVFGWDEKLNSYSYIFPIQETFCGEGDLEAPQCVLENKQPSDLGTIQGKEALAGLRFGKRKIYPQKSLAYYFVLGVTDTFKDINRILKKFKGQNKVEISFKETKNYWLNLADSFSLDTGDFDFDNWFLWVNIQPTLRRIYGCSFLPDFDYGKGGRGWRDLWQDCLALVLKEPEKLKKTLINNFSGVRIDGSNATIISKKELEFISDRNRISRVWMDHGIWPVLTLGFYLNETGDFDILFEKITYFRDHQIFRAQKVDYGFNSQREGNFLKTTKGKVYKGTILEHILVQLLTQFFNVGPHNFIRLENADWNDGLDMASKHGESIAFSCMYAACMKYLALILKKIKIKKIRLLKELKILFEKLDYNNIHLKKELLWNYFDKVKDGASGESFYIEKEKLIKNLEEKSEWLTKHILKNAWLKEGFFNGYYDERKRKVEGSKNGSVRIMLQSQVFPILSGIAQDWQIKAIIKNVRKYLWNKKLGGIHLNTDFKTQKLDLGRAFSFVYGDKENGAFFNHMVVMYSYALYSRGFIKEGWQTLESVYKMAMGQEAKIYPCLPEYFDLEGRGKYLYLTGSASWFIITLITEVFGIKGDFGDLLIEPKLLASQFKKKEITLKRRFAQRDFAFKFLYNEKKEDDSVLKIKKVTLDFKDIESSPKSVLIPRKKILKLSPNKTHIVEIILENF